MIQAVDEQTFLITGATDGLGKQVALDLARRQATVLLNGRSREKGESVLKELREATGNRKLYYYNADLSSLDDVRELSKAVQSEQKRLDVLINNAGIGPGLAGGGRETSKDGHELRFAVNYLAHFLLTHNLLPLLLRSTPSRIVNVASAGQQPIDFEDVMLVKNYDGLRAYRQSKLAMVMFTFDLAEHLKDSAITVNCLHPATLMPTTMVRETDYFRNSMSTLAEGARAVEYLAASPDLAQITGTYFDGESPGRPIAQAYDKHARQNLWELSLQLTQPDAQA